MSFEDPRLVRAMSYETLDRLVEQLRTRHPTRSGRDRGKALECAVHLALRRRYGQVFYCRSGVCPRRAPVHQPCCTDVHCAPEAAMGHLLGYPGHALVVPDIVRAEGCFVWNAAGRRWVDLESGVWCTPLGHGHPRVRRALVEQASRLVHAGFGWSSPVVEEAAQEVLAALGFDDGRCVLLCSGSEAVEYGVRVARAVAPLTRVLTMADSYFGAYGAAAARPPEQWTVFDWTRCRGDAGRDGCGPGCPHWDEIPFAEIGCFLLEPGSSSGLVRFPPADLVEAVAREVQDRGGVLMVNEVTTGIGRTGEWFGFAHYRVRPDLVALGKGVGNGYPVSVTAMTSAVAGRLGEGGIRWAQSHQNDPLGAAVAREVLRTVREERLVERGRRVAAALRRGLDAVRERSDAIAEIRSRGLMLALELVDTAGVPRTREVVRQLLADGFIVAQRPGLPVLRLDPPLTLPDEQCTAFLESLEAALRGARLEVP